MTTCSSRTGWRNAVRPRAGRFPVGTSSGRICSRRRSGARDRPVESGSGVFCRSRPHLGRAVSLDDSEPAITQDRLLGARQSLVRRASSADGVTVRMIQWASRSSAELDDAFGESPSRLSRPRESRSSVKRLAALEVLAREDFLPVTGASRRLTTRSGVAQHLALLDQFLAVRSSESSPASVPIDDDRAGLGSSPVVSS